jgi:hypothetical protein
VRLDFAALPSEAELRAALTETIAGPLYYDDIHGSPDWRRHMTFRFAGQIREEFASS